MNNRGQFAVAFGIVLMAPLAALAEVPTVPETCNVRFAETVLRSESLSTLCGCDRVTRGFVVKLQRSSAFEDVLGTTGENCPAMATVLTETVTNTVAPPAPNEGGGDDGDRPGFDFGPPRGQPQTPPTEEPPTEEPPADDPGNPPTGYDDVDNGW